MEGLKSLIEKYRVNLNLENEVLAKIEKAYLELSKLLPEEDRARVKIKDFVRNMKNGESDIVKLNVGGNIFYTLKSTLTKKIQKETCDEFYGTHLLEDMFEESERNRTQIKFIDRDPTYFNYILDYLRNSNEKLSLPDDEFILKKILREAKYFMLDGLSMKLEDYLPLLSIELDSLILSKIQVKDLIKLCGFRDQDKWKMLYRASKDGFSAANFHTKCDGQSNTLTIIKSTNGKIFGGFTTKSWSQNAGFVADPEAFIFSLTNNQNKSTKFKCINPQYAIINNASYGPIFGQSELLICSDSNISNSSICNLGTDYNNQNLNLVKNSEPAKSFLAGSHNFQTNEIEVFSLKN